MRCRTKQKRPKSQLKTANHAKRKTEELGRKLKKTKRVHEQRNKWSKLENEGRKTDPQWK